METESIQEMFPTKNEQRIARKVIGTIQKCPDSNSLHISELISPSKSSEARIVECNGLNHILDGLRALGIISCKKDHFNLTHKSQFRVKKATSNKSKRKMSSFRSGHKRYVVFECVNCGTANGSRSSQQSAACKTCNQKNKVDDTLKVLLKTNNILELQESIQQSKIQKQLYRNYRRLSLCK